MEIPGYTKKVSYLKANNISNFLDSSKIIMNNSPLLSKYVPIDFPNIFEDHFN